MRSQRRLALVDERAFTLIELLVVILIIGILAAIALPVFLGQTSKGQDGEAKANVRNLLSQVETCYVEEEDFRNCNSATELGATGLPYGSNQGEVEVTSANKTRFVGVAHSRSGNDFTIVSQVGGVRRRTCTAPGTGSCPASGNW
jgi:type IV pilus assembly protein PilA